MDSGFVKLYRKIEESSFYKDSEAVHLWVHLLLCASYKQRKIIFNGIEMELKSGQFITGRKALEAATGIEQSKCERLLKLFKTTQQIEQQKTNKFRIITICNWDRYQENEQQNEQQVNNNRTTSEHKQEGKELKEVNNTPFPPIEKKKKEQKKKPTPLPEGFSISERVREWAAKKNTVHLEEHLENFVSSCQAKGYEYLDWDAAFMNAVRQNWAKIGGNGNVGIRTSRSDLLDKNLQSRTDAEVSAALAKYEATKKSTGNHSGGVAVNDDAPSFQE